MKAETPKINTWGIAEGRKFLVGKYPGLGQFYSTDVDTWTLKHETPILQLKDPVWEILPDKDLNNEQELWYSVLVQALADYATLVKKKSSNGLKEIFDWFFNESVILGSFEYICEILELDPNYLRKKIILYTKNVNNILIYSRRRRR